MSEHFEKDPNLEEKTTSSWLDSLEDVIRSTHEELARSDALMGAQQEEKPNMEIPSFVLEDEKKENDAFFQPQIPREYAELTLDEPEEETPAAEETEEEPPAEEEEEDSAEEESSSGVKTFVYVAAVLVISLILAVVGWVFLDDICAFTGTGQSAVITVEEHDDVGEITDKLKDAGLIQHKWLFRFYCVLANADDKIRPGAYDLNDLLDYHALVNAMASVAQRATVEVMIPEGYEVKQIFALLEKKGVCTEEELWDAAANEEFDYEFLVGTTLGDRNRLEGCLFPDTYEFYVGDNARNVLLKFLRNTDKKLTDKYYKALDELNATLRARKAKNGFTQQEIAEGELSMHDLLILASLIEKEAANVQEATTISSVIYNRLCSKKYPCLNIDATIQYILEERKEVLTQQDTLIDSPYNTYKYPGLPAGPIANPGMSSIRGALYPAETDYYFYALGDDGVHHFFRTYNEHLAFIGGYGW